jgi:hypothetical protein
MRQISRLAENEGNNIKRKTSLSVFAYRPNPRGFFIRLKKMFKKPFVIEIWGCILPSGRQYE